jgi:hypothetical protein
MAVGLGQLLQAEFCGRDSLQIAIGMDELTAAGLATNDLRWLMAKAYIEVVQVTGAADYSVDVELAVPGIDN